MAQPSKAEIPNPQPSQQLGELLCAVLALVALLGTWGHNLSYLHLGFLEATRTFWLDTLATPASRSITVDLLALVLPVMFWMFSEARRLSMAGIWLYVLASLLVAISVAVPVFLIHRARAQRRLAEQPAAAASGSDKLAMLLLTLVALGYLGLSFGWFR